MRTGQRLPGVEAGSVEAIPERILRRFHMPFTMRTSRELPDPMVGWHMGLLDSAEEARRIYFSQVLPILPRGQQVLPRSLHLRLLSSLRAGQRAIITGGITRVGRGTFDWTVQVSRYHMGEPVAYLSATFHLVDSLTGSALLLPLTVEEKVSAFEGTENVEIGGP
jgi:acyl-CoA thioesterase FadM